MAMPCGHDANNLPIGMQLIAPPFAEETILRAGDASSARARSSRGHRRSERTTSMNREAYEAVIGLEVHTHV